MSIGLGRRSLGGSALALAGGGLLYRSLRGQGQPSHAPARALRERVAWPKATTRAGMEGLQRSITIQKPAQELYRAWRAAGNLSRVMGHFADVTEAGPDGQRWKVQAPLGRTLEWESHIVEEHPGELLRWEAVEGSELPNEGWVRFRPAPGDWGTVVTLRLRFSPPAGAVGSAAMKLLGDVPSTLAMKALKRFKSLVECGEIPTTRPNPAAREGGYSY